MNIIAWIDRRLPGDQRLHFVACALIATAGAHAAAFLGLPAWAGALVATVVVGGAYKLWQLKTGRGHASMNDMAANLAGGAIVALATLA